MTRRLIVWNRHKLEALEEAIALAEAGGLHVVEWSEQDTPSRFSRGIERRFTMQEARETADRVRCDLAINPMPNLPENREGPEP